MASNPSAEVTAKIKRAETSRKLDLSNSKLFEELPAGLFKLKNLKSLNLYRNQLKQLPDALFTELEALNELTLYRNLLSSIPPGIALMKNLTLLNLGSNRLTEVPNELFELRGLEELDLSNNSLSMIPPSIGNLVQLRDLKLFRNKLTVLPPEIGNLRNLKKLDMNHNTLTVLPSAMGRLTSLIMLDVTDNPLTSPPIYVCNRGSLAIIKFLKDQLEDETTPSKCTAEGQGLLSAIANEEVSFVITAKTANGYESEVGGDKFVASLVGPNGLVVPCAVKDNEDGTHRVTYTATISGSYSLEVTLHGHHISGSPFELQVEAGEASAPQCSASGSGLAGSVSGKRASFTIEAKDKNGNARTSGGSNFDVKIEGPEQAKVTVEDNKNGTYDVIYTANSAGTYRTSINLSGVPIGGSPFSVEVSEKPALPAATTKETETKARSGSDASASAKESMEQTLKKLERKVAKLKKSAKKRDAEMKKAENDKIIAVEEANSWKAQYEKVKAEKEKLEQETKMTEEIKIWKKTLEEKFNETKQKLEAEADTRILLEKVLHQMKAELEEEVKARTDLEDLKNSLETETDELKKRLAELEDLRLSLEDETRARDVWKSQLEQEHAELKSNLDSKQSPETEQLLNDLARELEDERKARIDLESSKKLVLAEVKEVNQMIREVEESRTHLLKETSTAQEVGIWKAKMEKEARMRLTMEKLKQKLEIESSQVKRKLEIETGTRKLLETKLKDMQQRLSAHSPANGPASIVPSKSEEHVEAEISAMRQMIEAEAKARSELEQSKRQLEQEIEALRKQLERRPEQPATDPTPPKETQTVSPSLPSETAVSETAVPATKAEEPKPELPPALTRERRNSVASRSSRKLSVTAAEVKGMRNAVDPAKLSFREKLSFWGTLKIEQP
eukprot:TRINITY_DN433_c0_g1_i2.p1 TRINITY_DN433_c0_g1~~TRINITY_DN433_c0_g1_i2.p1  ORF type:complete len:905 (+),score=297.74 TRINITY_DN433_c0_g1_i2:215-2929(+)